MRRGIQWGGPITRKYGAPCKVNLTLDVFPPRPDGFHDLDSVVAKFTPVDLLTVRYDPGETEDGEPIAERRPSNIEFSCSDASLPQGVDNLVLRAAAEYLSRRDLAPGGAAWRVRLEKRVPHQAGLGGGSSDAAAMLEALHAFYMGGGRASTDADAAGAAAAVGSDVPLFLHHGPVRMRGRGEVIEGLPAPLPRLFGVIVKPAVGVPTGPAYAALDALPGRRPGCATDRMLAALADGADVEAVAGVMGNDFEAAILPAYPEVAEAHRAVTAAGALRTLLCGSGSAVFGLARDREHAERLTNELTGRFPWVHFAEGLT